MILEPFGQITIPPEFVPAKPTLQGNAENIPIAEFPSRAITKKVLSEKVFLHEDDIVFQDVPVLYLIPGKRAIVNTFGIRSFDPAIEGITLSIYDKILGARNADGPQQHQHPPIEL